jgi:putative transcriptional regulator
MRWNLRLAAANRGIWKASEMQKLLADRGLVMSAGKLSGLWSGQPNSIKLDELEIFCAVLGCGPEELLIREPGAVPAPLPADNDKPAAATGTGPSVRPRKPQRRTPPPA